jgi:hypothetical protein
MKYKVQKEEYKRVLLEEVEVDIPEEPKYFWHNGERVAYCVTPIWTKWNKEHYQKEEEIWELRIVKVDPSFRKIQAFFIRVSEFGEILQGKRDGHKLQRLIENLLLYPEENIRTKEQFMTDYHNTLKEIDNYITLADYESSTDTETEI